ncbi:MAG: winged helix-turn-helix domain-containing protein [Eubacteriales bacterium]|nr:winged helix-turn-helix domain-containing protein [Eubacteriales bacterium]
MINILVIESREEDGILQEVVDFLSSRTQCQVTHLTSSPQALKFPGLEIRINEQTVYQNGIPVPLTHHEFFTLLYLAQYPSWVLSQSMIYEAVWKADSEHCGAAVTNVISQIRRKIGDGYIETVVGSGYKFVG